MKRPLCALLSAAWMCGALPLAALEVSLEENRAQRGSVGYADMQRIFRSYPETQRAKQSFADIIRQAEEGVNLKKAELQKLRSEISRLNAEHEILSRTPIQISEPAKPLVPALAPTASEKPRRDPLVIRIPGVADEPIIIQPSSEDVHASTPNASVSLSSAAALPDPVAESAARHGARLKELEEQVASKITELGRRESAFKEYQLQAEKSLTELESRRSEMLLGRIYDALREVARENSISVVVDKSQIIFGQNTVDLTDKVIKKLGGPRS